MRIAFDYQIFFLQSYGGISRYFVLLAEQLIAKNINIGIFAPFYKNHYLKRLTTNVVHGYAFSAYPQRSSFLMRQLNNMFSNNAINNWNPQIVHETYYSKKGSAPKGSLTVITVYDMIQELFADSFYAHSNTTNLKKIAIERADHVICISENTRQDLFRLFGTKENKVSVVHLGVENSLLDYQV